MQGNPFYIEPLGGYGKSINETLAGLGAVLGKRREEDRLKAKKQTLFDEASRLLKEGTQDEIWQHAVKNPEITEVLNQRMGFLNKESRQNAYETAQSIANGANPIDAYGKRIQYLQNIGANPKDTLEELDNAMQSYADDPEAYRNTVARSIPYLFSEEYGNYRKLNTPAEGEKLTGNAANTALTMFGTADISRLSPEQRQQLNTEMQRSGGDQKTPAKVLEWQEYKRILEEEGPDAAQSFGQAAGFADKAGKISPFVEKQLSAATNSVFESETNIAQYDQLAADLEEADFGGGVAGGSWKEKIKDLTGMQDAATELRRKFNGIKASAVVKNLPPGAASDADIAFAMSGFPTDNYDAKMLAQFLRGMSKIEAQNVKFNEFKADYISNNKSESGLLRSWKQSQGVDSGGNNAVKPNSAQRKPTQSAPMKPKNQPKFTADEISEAAKNLGVSVEEFKRVTEQ